MTSHLSNTMSARLHRLLLAAQTSEMDMKHAACLVLGGHDKFLGVNSRRSRLRDAGKPTVWCSRHAEGAVCEQIYQHFYRTDRKKRRCVLQAPP